MNLLDYLVSLRTRKVLLHSYHINVKIALIYNIAQRLIKDRISICIINYDKFLKLSGIELEQQCNESSYVIVFEAEDPSNLPMRYNLVTSFVKINKYFDEILRIDKISTNLYKTQDNTGNIFIFSIINGEVIDRKLRPIHEAIINFLKEYGGEVEIRDLVNILSKKYETNRDNVRVELSFLKELGIIEVKDRKVILTQLL
ncbi:hypothetical protein GFS03_08770 [Sulfolobus sp. E5-1-F]|uniref:hypothetical protein n=1 Tax=Saccharolobus sp. E5-1-F TaxID=2663019 RepID=UPI0012980050|nr:hypothetical protein [Sulfolobus sp. E5-1-F]QGA54658.1 hypothetical protein GFS03_08770 [Sulfolobus sp. E5-1-F]